MGSCVLWKLTLGFLPKPNCGTVFVGKARPVLVVGENRWVSKNRKFVEALPFLGFSHGSECNVGLPANGNQLLLVHETEICQSEEGEWIEMTQRKLLSFRMFGLSSGGNVDDEWMGFICSQ